MTAAAIASEDQIITRAQGILDRAEADMEYPWAADRQGRLSVRSCADGIAECLELHEDITSGRIHPERPFPDLGPGHPDDALATALDRVTADIATWTGAFLMAVREHAGEEIARRMNGEGNGGTQT